MVIPSCCHVSSNFLAVVMVALYDQLRWVFMKFLVKGKIIWTFALKSPSKNFRCSTFKDPSNDWLDNWCRKALSNSSHVFQNIKDFIFQFWSCFQNWKVCTYGSSPSCYSFFQMWFELSSWCEPFIKRSSIQFFISTTNFSWFSMEGFQVVKIISEITMFFHNCKNGRSKVWCKLVNVSTLCLSSLCWFGVLILLSFFLFDFFLCH